jgi:hypothetical protein
MNTYVLIALAYIALFLSILFAPWGVSVVVGVGGFLMIYIKERLWEVKPQWMEWLLDD